MGDIFVSYAREDRAKAKDLAEALQEQGWNVWWDRDIRPGGIFDEVISRSLNSAKCVIVLWSEASTRSEFAKEEATEGAKRHILAPVLIEDVEIPLGFRRIFSGSLPWSTAIVSPSEMPITLPDQAATVEGYRNKESATNKKNIMISLSC